MAAAMFPPGTDLSQIPAMPPPPGVVPNFENPESRSAGFTAVIAIGLFLAIVSTLIRVWVNVSFSRNGLGPEGWLAIVSAVFVVAYNCVVIAMFWLGGLGMHTWDVRLTTFDTNYFARFLGLQAINPMCLMFIKLSISFLYLRIFGVKGTMVRKVIWSFIVLNVLIYVILMILDLVYCVPNFKTDNITQGECGSKGGNAIWAVSAWSIIGDFWLLGLAFYCVFKLQMSTKKRLGVMAILSSGLFATVITILVLAYRVMSLNQGDPAWNLAPSGVLSCCEMNVGLVTANAPSFSLLWKSMGTGRSGATSFKSFMSVLRGNRSQDPRAPMNRSRRSDYPERLSEHSDKVSLANSNRIKRTDEIEITSTSVYNHEMNGLSHDGVARAV